MSPGCQSPRHARNVVPREDLCWGGRSPWDGPKPLTKALVEYFDGMPLRFRSVLIDRVPHEEVMSHKQQLVRLVR